MQSPERGILVRIQCVGTVCGRQRMSSSTSLSLLVQLREPDSTAWNQFVELYTPLLYHWATRSGLSHHDAAELSQEVFITLLHALPTFQYDRQRSFRAWLYTIMRNKWTDLLRKRGKLPGDDAGLSAAAAPSDILELEEAEYRSHLIHRAMELVEAEIGATTIAAFRKTAIEKLPTSEVAKELGISENAIYLARRRVMQRLREHLEGMWE